MIACNESTENVCCSKIILEIKVEIILLNERNAKKYPGILWILWFMGYDIHYQTKLNRLINFTQQWNCFRYIKIRTLKHDVHPVENIFIRNFHTSLLLTPFKQLFSHGFNEYDVSMSRPTHYIFYEILMPNSTAVFSHLFEQGMNFRAWISEIQMLAMDSSGVEDYQTHAFQSACQSECHPCQNMGTLHLDSLHQIGICPTLNSQTRNVFLQKYYTTLSSSKSYT